MSCNNNTRSAASVGEEDEDKEQLIARQHCQPENLLQRNDVLVRPNIGSKVSSLDFERVVNNYSIQVLRNQYFVSCNDDDDHDACDGGYDTFPSAPTPATTPQKRTIRRNGTRWALSAIVGLATGLTTTLIVQITQSIVRWRINMLDQMMQDPSFSTLVVFSGFTTFNLLLALGASFLCVHVAPDATGSGIPEVKAYLNGVRVKKFSFWSLFWVKIVGTILSVSSSLAVGMEGPLIHIGAIVGASFTKLGSLLINILSWIQQQERLAPFSLSPLAQSLWAFAIGNLSHFSIDSERRDLISIGASVGFAASFGAPIGGLLFLVDDLSSFFSKNMILRTLFANAIGTFCLAVHSGNLSNYSIINLGTFQGGTNDIFLTRFELIPLFVVVAVVGGALGGIFCANFEFLKIHVVERLTSKSAKMIQIAILSLLTSILTFGLPVMGWACKDFDDTRKDHGRQFFCQPGQVNELATIMFGSRDDAIKRILADTSQFQPGTLWTVGLLFYFLMTFTYGSILPSGIFTPTVLIGASLGGAAGLAFEDLFGPTVTPSTFALLGVAAILAGIQRSTVSICVILVEGTGEIKVLLPVIVVVLVARYVAEFFHPQGIYDTAMTLKQYSYLDHEEKRHCDIFQVKDIMSRPPQVIPPIVKASHLVQLLQTSPHNGYPVVDPSTKKFLGLVRRDQIVALLECGVFQESDQSSLTEIMEVNSSSNPPRRISKSPLMHLAYHIKDDRYDYLKHVRPIPDDDFDRHELLTNTRQSIRTVPNEICRSSRLRRISVAGNESMPLLDHILLPVMNENDDEPALNGDDDVSSSCSPSMSAPKGFADVGVDPTGNLVITWLNPDCRDLYVNVSAVMNQGAYCVPEHLPVSKARCLFTQLGLRHVTVLGGESGGEVVGVFTRGNLTLDYIRQQTGIVVEDN